MRAMVVLLWAALSVGFLALTGYLAYAFVTMACGPTQITCGFGVFTSGLLCGFASVLLMVLATACAEGGRS